MSNVEAVEGPGRLWWKVLAGGSGRGLSCPSPDVHGPFQSYELFLMKGKKVHSEMSASRPGLISMLVPHPAGALNISCYPCPVGKHEVVLLGSQVKAGDWRGFWNLSMALPLHGG